MQMLNKNTPRIAPSGIPVTIFPDPLQPIT